ncbi:MAG: ribulokinase [Deltaproteobacteria bacterium]|nr:ribulokinase [Deltaproteobacteria bacterium]
MKEKQLVIGLDFGTDSVRALVVDTQNGKEIAESSFLYPRWKEGLYCNPGENRFRQHPLDYIEGITFTIQEALKGLSSDDKKSVRGISVDTTGSTIAAVNQNCRPLALEDGYSEDPDAMFILWKDHTAVAEADEINHISRTWGGEDYTKYCGGIYSSEWFWSKIIHTLRGNEKIRDAAYSWVEHCDWIPALLCGSTDPVTIKRSRCAAGHKALWHPSWNGLPPEEFLVKLDPLLAGLRDRLFVETYTSDVPFGTLCSEWAMKLGLSEDVVVGVGAFDAHMGAVGGAIGPYALSKVMGTSTCDMMIASHDDIGDNLVAGICGQVDGSVAPGMIGLEAGQSAFGDIYAWFRSVLAWPLKLAPESMKSEVDRIIDGIIPALSEAIAPMTPGESSILALDWMNGRRTPDANQNLKGAIMGLTLGSDAPKIFRALVEASAFGALAIVERFRSEGVRIDEVIALGGVAKKSPVIMQIMADVLGMKIKVHSSNQTCALGAAMFAAVASGLYADIPSAQNAMDMGFEREYQPDMAANAVYKKLFRQYCEVGAYVEEREKGGVPK